jgi:glycosyltransferase involved in cell wall biosynthesis
VTIKSPLHVLVVYDGKRGPTATQMISFGHPFDPANGEARISFEKHYTDPAEIEKAFASHRPQLIVLSRYTSERGQDWIRLARDSRIPVIFHIDDDLLAVPPSLGEAKFKAYNDPARVNALRANIESSDLLYVSTAELGRRFGEYGLRTRIIAGHIYCSVSVDEIGASLPPATGPVIGYMGTSGHSADLAMIMPAIIEVMESIPELHFEVFGTIEMPADLVRFGSRARHIAPVADYGEFLTKLRSLGWWVGLAPLEDNRFNRCKADTKWVECSMAGMAVVASDLPVYHCACADGSGILAQSQKEWKDGIRQLICRPDLRTQMIERARAKLRDNYTHECLRSQTMAIFELAMAGRT